MPPQGYVMLGGLGLNYVAARRGKPTISQWARRHKAVAAVAWAALNLWLIPHILRRVDDAIAAFDNTLDPDPDQES